jgi:hypothetical protein
MSSFYRTAWAVADERGWTDNTLLHALMDVLEQEPREVQERIIALLGEKE